MADAALDTSNVHLGHWTNWSYGAARGSTVTLTRQDGALLTAFTALFVGYAGSRIWRIICFALHLVFSNEAPQDALYHQRQALLRNSLSGDTTVWDLCIVLWVWRKKARTKSIFIRILPLLVLGLITSLAFAAAGVFSAQISSSMGTEVLLSAKNCALVYQNLDATATDYATFMLPYLTERNKAAFERADQCFSANATSGSCSTYVRPYFPLTVTTNASCPFKDRVCRNTTANIMVDTGFLNSHDDFGVNTSPSDRFAVRQVYHCAPLAIDEYANVSSFYIDPYSNTSKYYDGRKIVQFSYGRNSNLQSTNITYEYPVNEPHNLWGTADEQDYSIRSMLAFANNTNSAAIDFASIEQLTLPDSDTWLFFLSANNIFFTAPVDDLWYSAHQQLSPLQNTGTDAGQIPAYQADYPANVIGCTTRYQYCNPNLPIETGCVAPFSPTRKTTTEHVRSIFKTERQQDLFENFAQILQLAPSMSIGTVVDSLGVGALKSRNTLGRGVQAPLPANQWQLEVQSWVSTVLAGQQRAFVEHSTGTLGMSEVYLQRPSTAGNRTFCNSQKILSTDSTSFSTLGLILTFTIGGFFIVLSFFVEAIVHWIQRRWRWDPYALMEWNMNDKLNLQSCVHEELGLGTWTREVGVVPTTQRGEKLAILNLGLAPMHPRWRAPPQAWEQHMKHTGGQNDDANPASATPAQGRGNGTSQQGRNVTAQVSDDTTNVGRTAGALMVQIRDLEPDN